MSVIKFSWGPHTLARNMVRRLSASFYKNNKALRFECGPRGRGDLTPAKFKNVMLHKLSYFEKILRTLNAVLIKLYWQMFLSLRLVLGMFTEYPAVANGRTVCCRQDVTSNKC